MRIGPLRLKLQLACGEGSSESWAMGPGKADLLDAIGRERSISGAGRALGMSYRRAWLLVDEMNRCFEAKLVETLAGGGRERGARLTATGREVLDLYRSVEAEAARASEGAAFARLTGLLRETPKEG